MGLSGMYQTFLIWKSWVVQVSSVIPFDCADSICGSGVAAETGIGICCFGRCSLGSVGGCC